MSKEIPIYLTSEEIHWLKYLIFCSVEDYKNDPEKYALYLKVLEKFSAAESEGINKLDRN